MLTARSLTVACARKLARSRPAGATKVVVRALTDPTQNVRSAVGAAAAAATAEAPSVAYHGKEGQQGLQQAGEKKRDVLDGGDSQEEPTRLRAFNVSP